MVIYVTPLIVVMGVRVLVINVKPFIVVTGVRVFGN
jgi:hypothetical protein